jgi:hypothetical protein
MAEPTPPADPTRSPSEVPSGSPAPDEPIPMLTEVVQVPRYATHELPRSLGDVDWAALAERVRENVTERLSRRSQALLDAQMRESLQAIVDRAAEALALELRTTMAQVVREIVDRAVTEELTRLHAEITRRGG